MNEKKTAHLYLEYISDESKKTVAELNGILNNYGLNFEFVKENLFTINFDTEVFKRKTKRGAGAKQKFLNKSYPLTEIKARIASSSAQQVADEIGISRATLFRRIKVAENCSDDMVYI